jgi:uroporphyrinogen III methyltransferase/synthase
MDSSKPIVYLVGAGPGDPGLLTLRGKECLEQADFVLYDQLVSARILDLIPAQVEKKCVRELPGCHVERWPHIHQSLVDEARKGKCVVRLKGGDPLIFGRGGEEAEVLRQAGIPFEIVPGVTAALAAGAYLEIPLTHRTIASGIAFITGHEQPGKPASKLSWEAIANFPGTLVIYMGISRLAAISSELIRCGKPANTPAEAVSKASTGEQQSVTTTLEKLDEAVRQAGLVTPALVILGPVVELRPTKSWFECRPLLGKRILITRPRRQAEPMMHQLELLGAVPWLLPAVEIQEPPSWEPVDAAVEEIAHGAFHWLIFTSANGVKAFFQRLRSLGKDLRVLGRIRLAAIGSKTAEALREYHLDPDVVPADDMRSEGFAPILQHKVAGQRVLIAQVDRGRELLREQLSQVAVVETIVVYCQNDAVDPKSAVFDHLRRGEIDIVTLTSTSIAQSFLSACDETIKHRLLQGQIQVISNSARTTALVRELGITNVRQSENPTGDSVIQAILNHVDGAMAK